MKLFGERVNYHIQGEFCRTFGVYVLFKRNKESIEVATELSLVDVHCCRLGY